MVSLRDILKENDLIGEIVSAVTIPVNPSRAFIDNALVTFGYVLPLPYKVSFHMTDGSRMYLVTWFPKLDQYGYEQLTMKG